MITQTELDALRRVLDFARQRLDTDDQALRDAMADDLTLLENWHSAQAVEFIDEEEVHIDRKIGLNTGD